ncbi:hypothetical protein ABZ858_01695 [Streptomyces sp. NPDC047017]|uniref:hypothetical protein n=1 Tax=Streptomyces sp. NPDC047017 TaxID=3155024 RepID=UPI003405FC47
MRTLARWARAEWGPLLRAVRGRAGRRRVRHGAPPAAPVAAPAAWARAVPMTLAAVGLTALLQFAQNHPWGYALVQRAGTVRAADPPGPALLRTPLSLFVAALDLPVWGALAQILGVFGIAELCLGRRRTLAVAYAATLAGTLYARVGVALGPHRPLGLPGTDAHVVDTGPSAAVVGLAVYVGLRHRAYVTAGAVTAAMAVEVAVKENLAGKEHLAAIAAVALAHGLSVLRRRAPARWRRSAHSPPGPGPGGGGGGGPGSRAGRTSGLPPIQS